MKEEMRMATIQLAEQICENMKQKSTAELLEIWKENNTEEWSREAFEVVRQILFERGETLPSQGLTGETAVSFEVKRVAFASRQKWVIYLSPNSIKFSDQEGGEAVEIPRCDADASLKFSTSFIPRYSLIVGHGGKTYYFDVERGDLSRLRAWLQRAKAEKEVKKTEIEVCFPDGGIKVYEIGELRDDIVKGNVKKDYKCRPNVLVQPKGKEKEPKKPDWTTIEKLSNSNFELQVLYKPLWAYAMKFCWYGVTVGAALKALDTTFLFAGIDSTLCLTWLIVVGSLLVGRWFPWAWIVALIISWKSGVRINLFLSVFVVGFIGAIFGGPVGMAIGTIVGHFKQKGLPKAQDAVSEGNRPYILGLLIPLVWFVGAMSFYLFWLNPKIFEWVSKNP
ncbi:MAG: hypothetical protein PHE61_04010 [Candidatus Omnitrophica bacterium]|nr:hypothetical protein [Candidatus Omnitrophota bacterium]